MIEKVLFHPNCVPTIWRGTMMEFMALPLEVIRYMCDAPRAFVEALGLWTIVKDGVVINPVKNEGD